MSYTRKTDGLYVGDDGRIYNHQRYKTMIFWSPQMISDLKRYFPTTLNEELAGILNVSPRTMVRKARELGLEKDKVWLRAIWEERRLMAHVESKRRGYPGSFKKGNMIGVEYRFKKKGEE